MIWKLFTKYWNKYSLSEYYPQSVENYSQIVEKEIHGQEIAVPAMEKPHWSETPANRMVAGLRKFSFTNIF